jgi:glycosyltransferase involved in cell wall biosynthesis
MKSLHRKILEWLARKSRRHEQSELSRLQVAMMKYKPFVEAATGGGSHSIDDMPWRHPFLTRGNIASFREYSERVWEFAREYEGNRKSYPLRIAFSVNMNQNMHKWAMLAQKYGVQATLFLNPMERSAIMAPEWELYDGEYPNIQDGEGFQRKARNIRLEVPCRKVMMDGSALISSYERFLRGDRSTFIRILGCAREIRPETLISYQGFYPYYEWARAFEPFDVIYGMDPIGAAYASGKPYCVSPYGGDLMYVCGRADDTGMIAHLGYNAARFLMASNPHTLAQCRRLGLTNAVYLPYPMDDHRYSPDEGKARREWEQKWGKGVYVLMTSRIDSKWKGQDARFLDALLDVARKRPAVRFVFLGWGNQLEELKDKIGANGIGDQFIVLNPAGKMLLLDYYRSSDIILDHFLMGYYGSTALEAAAVGKPVIMKLRGEHYAPLYKGDVMPALHADTPEEIARHILRLADDRDLRRGSGVAMREWLVRNHGEEKTVPLLLSLLRMTADRVPLPEEIQAGNPLLAEESGKEKHYHQLCRVQST